MIHSCRQDGPAAAPRVPTEGGKASPFRSPSLPPSHGVLFRRCFLSFQAVDSEKQTPQMIMIITPRTPRRYRIICVW